MSFSPRWLLSLGSTGSSAHRPQYFSSRAREPRPSGCDAWAQLLCHVRSSQIRGGTHVPCFGRKALRRILGSSFPRSYLLREAWEPGVLSHSAGSAIKSSGTSSERLPLPQSCLTLRDQAHYSPRGSSVHGISQARLLEWVVISFSIQLIFLNVLQQSFAIGKSYTI